MTVENTVGSCKVYPFMENGKALISKTTATNNLKASILKSVSLIGGFAKAIERGDEIWLKPNFNTGDTPPGSSDTGFVKAVIELLVENGAGKVIVGESSMMSASTRNIFQETDMLRRAEEAGAEVMFFDEGKWVKVETGGKYLRKVSLPEKALDAKKLIYVCCMKTHKWAKFTLSLKLAVGFMKPSERTLLHLRHIEERIADLNLVVHTNLVIMDGRACFINGGPACGERRSPNVILASGDRMAIDVEAIKTIQSYESNSLPDNPWNYTQIRRAAQLGIGVKSEAEYTVVKDLRSS